MCLIDTWTRVCRGMGLAEAEEQDLVWLGSDLGDQHMTAIIYLSQRKALYQETECGSFPEAG